MNPLSALEPDPAARRDPTPLQEPRPAEAGAVARGDNAYTILVAEGDPFLSPRRILYQGVHVTGDSSALYALGPDEPVSRALRVVGETTSFTQYQEVAA